MLTLTRPLVGLDLETTSTNVDEARIVQIAFKIRNPDGTDGKQWSSLVNPGIPIPRESTEIHGITNEMVAGKPMFRQLASNLAGGFKDCDYAGYNVRFDLRVLAAEMQRVRGVEWSYAGAKVIDAYRLWQIKKPRTLTGACQEILGREPRDAHEAMADVEDALDVIDGLLAKYNDLPRNAAQLHELQWPGEIDPDGKFVFVNGHAVLNFSKHKGTKLRDIDPGFFQWMLKGDFSPHVKQIARDALRGVFPIRPTSES